MVGICDILQMEIEAQGDSVISPRLAQWVSCRAEPIICCVVTSSIQTLRERQDFPPLKVYKHAQKCHPRLRSDEDHWGIVGVVAHTAVQPPLANRSLALVIQIPARRRVNMPESSSAFSTSVDLIKKIDSPHKSGLTLTNHLIWHKELYSDSLNSTLVPETEVSDGLNA